MEEGQRGGRLLRDAGEIPDRIIGRDGGVGAGSMTARSRPASSYT
ncbi:MAG: hypothetical protein OJF50_005201 [Nitrospira sp.]|nr:hypothetical protein [Nitrospira sp.]